MVAIIAALLSGILFGAGLVVSHMVNPAKVLSFLDLFGIWDPSLAFVMAGAIAVMAPTWYIAGQRSKPLFADQFTLPAKNDFDAPLVVGGILFGIGWGLAGLCPGPALVTVGIYGTQFLHFVLAMIAGMVLYNLFSGFSGSLSTSHQKEGSA